MSENQSINSLGPEESAAHSRWSRIASGTAILLLWITAVGGWLWGFGAICYFSPLPVLIRGGCAILWLLAAPTVYILFTKYWIPAVILAGVLILNFIWMFHTPQLVRSWSSDQAVLPQAVIENDIILIKNIRHAFYRSEKDYDVHWYSRTFNLNELTTLDFIIEPFTDWQGPAHTLLSFGFSNGDYLAVSVEIRKERDEEFNALRGMFKQYELMYVVGEERDLIGLRANIRNNPVYVYPVKATPERVRLLFLDIIERINQLAVHPEFYHTLTNTCTTNIIDHINRLGRYSIGNQLGILLPGYADAAALNMGLIDFNGSIEEARAQFRINDRSQWHGDSRVWSKKIRPHSQED